MHTQRPRRSWSRLTRLLRLRGGDWTPAELMVRWLLPQDFRSVAPVVDVRHQSLCLDELLETGPGAHPWQQGSIHVRTFENVVFWPANGGIRTVDGALIGGLSHSQGKLQKSIAGRCFPRLPLIDEEAPCCCISHIDRNFYHRFVDSMPRVFALQHPEIRRYALIRLYVDDRFSCDERSLLHSLLPGNVEIVECSRFHQVRARTYIHLPLLSSRRTDATPDWQVESAGYLPPRYLNWFRERVDSHFGLSPLTEGTRRVFVSRAGAQVRRLLNETEVVALLTKFGFETLRLESLKLREQVQLFRESRIVVGQHGAGLTNVLYMPPGGSVIELMSSADRLKHYSLLAINLGLRHQFVCANGRTKNDDVRVDLDQLGYALNRSIARSPN